MTTTPTHPLADTLAAFAAGNIGPHSTEVAQLRKAGLVHKTRMALTVEGSRVIGATDIATAAAAKASRTAKAKVTSDGKIVGSGKAKAKATAKAILEGLQLGSAAKAQAERAGDDGRSTIEDLDATYLAAVEAAIDHSIPLTTLELVVADPEAVAAMDRIERVKLMKAEQAAIVAWKAAGSPGEAPPCPIRIAAALIGIDNGGIVTAKGTGNGHSRWQPETLAALLVRIQALRDDGKGWPAIAKLFNEDGTPTAKGGKWASSTVLGIGVRNGIPSTRPTSNVA